MLLQRREVLLHERFLAGPRPRPRFLPCRPLPCRHQRQHRAVHLPTHGVAALLLPPQLLLLPIWVSGGTPRGVAVLVPVTLSMRLLLLLLGGPKRQGAAPEGAQAALDHHL